MCLGPRSRLWTQSGHTIINSAVWGQVDAVFTFFIVLSACCLTRGWLIRAVVAFILALLLKPQALIFAPSAGRGPGTAVHGHSMPGQSKRSCGAWRLDWPYLSPEFRPLPWKRGRSGFSRITAPPYVLSLCLANAFNLFALSGGLYARKMGSWLVFSYKGWGTFFVVAATLFSFGGIFSGKRRAEAFLHGMFPHGGGVHSFLQDALKIPLSPPYFALLASLYSGNLKMSSSLRGTV